ncbi:MAG TPA: glutamate--tRNA ligase family protein [Chitinophagales bacterium]|nr:glutamate--tRNA ligase family protein [Chitinophagales bacterium]
MFRTRLAPTPSGYLHSGNALNFIITWLWARKENGSIRLRIDDLDSPRAKPEYLEDIFKTLEWLGLDWDEGPQTPDEQKRLYTQTLRAARYEELLNTLVNGNHTFACQCSRKELAGFEQYPGACINKHIAFTEPETAWRALTPDNTIVTINDFYNGALTVDLYGQMRHFVVRRRDGIPAYQIASLCDDIDYGINLIVRGHDLLTSTAAQIFLAGLTGLKEFPKTTFYHHPLLTDENGMKLSKSAGSSSLKSWREIYTQPDTFYQMLSEKFNWAEKINSAQELLTCVKQGMQVLPPG